MKHKQKCSLIIKNCTLLDAAFEVRPDMAIVVDGNRILDIRDSIGALDAYEADEVIDGKNKLAMPGMVDAHTHTVQQLLKGGTVDEMPIVWRRILVPYEVRMNEQDRYHAARLYCIQALKAGVTLFADAGSMHMDGTLRAVEETGIRAVITRVTRDVAGDLAEGSCDSTASEAVKKCEALYKEYDGAANGKIKIWFSLSSPQSTSPELAQMVADAAEQYDTGIHVHLCEHLAEVQHCLANFKMRPTEYFDKYGLISPRLLAAHCIHITDFDIRMMAERGMSIVHCPTSNLRTQGIPKITMERASGINIALGNDGATTARQDLLAQFQLLKYVSHAVYGLPIFDPVVLPYDECLPMCTINGARALHMERELGTLEVGKKADIQLINLLDPSMMPTRSLTKTLPMSGSMQNVTEVIIDGEVMIKDRQFTKLDEEEILWSGQRQLENMLQNRT